MVWHLIFSRVSGYFRGYEFYNLYLGFQPVITKVSKRGFFPARHCEVHSDVAIQPPKLFRQA